MRHLRREDVQEVVPNTMLKPVRVDPLKALRVGMALLVVELLLECVLGSEHVMLLKGLPVGILVFLQDLLSKSGVQRVALLMALITSFISSL